MSLMPAFSPHTSTYRFDKIAYEKQNELPLRSRYNIAFRPDGTQFFLTHEDAEPIFRYSCATAWDIGSVSSLSSIDITTSNSSRPRKGIHFNGDGTKVFVGTSGGGTNYIEEHALSSAYSGTPTYTARLAGAESEITGFTFIDDGEKIIAHTDGVFYDVSLSTAYDLTTAGAWSLAKLDLSSTYTAIENFTFGKTTAQMILCEVFSSGGNRKFHEYELSTPGDVSTASLLRSYDYDDDAGNQDDAVFGDGGKKMFSVGSKYMTQWSTVA